MRRFLPAVALVAAVVLTAPFVGVIRNRAFAAFPKAAVYGLGAILVAMAVAVLILAAVRIRHHRRARYAGIVAVVALVWIQYAGFSTEVFEVDLIERVHIFEYGLLAYLLYRAFLRGEEASRDLSLMLLPLLWVTLAGTLDEWVQWLAATRLGYIADVWLNVFAGVCGLLFGVCVEPPSGFQWRLGNGRMVARSASVTALGLGLFFFDAHLGHQIEDPEIGRFYSWFTREELLQAAADRAERWSEDPPEKISPWRMEDLFLSEAGWHALFRERCQERGFFYGALQANRILEKYYEPYLELESFLRPGKRRYSEERLREIEARARPPDDQPFTSPVLKSRIYTWPPKPLFLAIVLGAALLIWILPELCSSFMKGRASVSDA